MPTYRLVAVQEVGRAKYVHGFVGCRVGNWGASSPSPACEPLLFVPIVVPVLQTSNATTNPNDVAGQSLCPHRPVLWSRRFCSLTSLSPLPNYTALVGSNIRPSTTCGAHLFWAHYGARVAGAAHGYDYSPVYTLFNNKWKGPSN